MACKCHHRKKRRIGRSVTTHRKRGRGIFGNVGKNVKKLFSNAMNILPMIL